METNMRAFDYIDYKKPLFGQDFRTSSYLSHRHIPFDSNIKPSKNKNSKTFSNDPVLLHNRVTEYKNEFKLKSNINIGERINPKLNMKHQFIKPFEDQKFKILPRVMHPAMSISHQDYIWTGLPPEAPHRTLYFNKSIKTTPQVIDDNKPGYSKYLEAGATTNKLTYVHRTPEQMLSGIAACDAITFWNWKKNSLNSIPLYTRKNKQVCDEAPAERCKHPKTDHKRVVKFVPHNAFTTEVRDNYKGEVLLNDVKPGKNLRGYPIFDKMALSDQTENHIYGTGDSTRKYI
ncbi:uncharacterized protein LOC119681880 [Teleopsis dalmanni]|uniref:uncharacterized protein LOC119681880 n=1 Tax=Teleopsis dalmanni TaxID=139649 RepID=UPI000D32CD6B|nr:uncharacterized protein LOC119681880 [Teleopsis dalmanni]